MISTKTILTCALVLASVAAPIAVHYRNEARVREQTESLEQQNDDLAWLASENQRLSNHVAQANTSAPLTSEQRAELLRLRGEIRSLRSAAAERIKLQGANEKLAVARAKTEQSAPPPPSDALTLAYWPKDQLAFTGFADPESALKSALCAMTRGDLKAMLSAITPDMRASMAREGGHELTDDEIAARAKMMADTFEPNSAFRLIGKKTLSADRVILDVYFEGENKTRKFGLKKIGDEWKFAAFGWAGATDDQLQFR